MQALLIIAAFAIGFAAVGTLVGYGLGRFVPGYYRGVFSEGLRPDFNPPTLASVWVVLKDCCLVRLLERQSLSS